MKSAYNLIQRQKGLYSVADSSNLWNKVWKIKAPPKSLNLFWRALYYCLSTKIQLAIKHVQVDKRCPVCLSGDETILHSLVSCPFAAQCWRLIILNYCDPQEYDFLSWLERMFRDCSNNLYAEIAIVSWEIWNARNIFFWNKKRSLANSIVASAKQYLFKWRQA